MMYICHTKTKPYGQCSYKLLKEMGKGVKFSLAACYSGVPGDNVSNYDS
jgi:hypothetical protein